MYKSTHTVTCKRTGEVYSYPAYKAGKRVNGKVKTFMRVYGNKHTEQQAKDLVAQWEKDNA